MYVPEQFKQEDPDLLTAFIQKNNFATLFSGISGNLQASHLPIQLKPSLGKKGSLWGHMARASQHWQTIGPGEGVLTVFQGSHAYISPTWYGAENTVPTWNYTAVHVYGLYQPVHDPEKLKLMLKELVDRQESFLTPPWKVESLSPDFLEKMIGQIVGFEIEITDIQGKWKLNQNHPKERREKAARALRKRGGENNRSIADLMDGKSEI